MNFDFVPKTIEIKKVYLESQYVCAGNQLTGGKGDVYATKLAYSYAEYYWH